MHRPVITLTTDFGLDNSYVGAMKGVILRICPAAQLIDITHTIPPQDVFAAALTLQEFLPYYPPNTIHLVVVDPGVGSSRRPVAIETPTARLVGPDNGVFSLVCAKAATYQAVTLTESRFWLQSVSTTFHGRDIFAPVAAHLACGVALHELGPPLEMLVSLTLPALTWLSATVLRGEVAMIDHFGNAISTITAEVLAQLGPLAELVVMVRGQALGQIRTTYAHVAVGAAVALIGSSGRLEIAVRNGNASQTMDLQRGSEVQVVRRAS